MSTSVEDRISGHLRAAADDVTVGPAAFDAAYARGRRRRSRRRWTGGLAAVVVVALTLILTTSVFSAPRSTTMVWAGGTSAFDLVRTVALPGEKDTVGSVAQQDGKLWFSTLRGSGTPETERGERNRVYVAGRDGGAARQVGSARQVIAVLPGRGGRLWAVGADGVLPVDTGRERLGPARDAGWRQAYSAVGYRGDLYVVARASDTRWLLARVDGATGEVVGTPYRFTEQETEYGSPQATLKVTADGLTILYNPYVGRRLGAAKVSADGVPGKVRTVKAPSNTANPATLDGAAVYERLQVGGKPTGSSYLVRRDRTTGAVTRAKPLVTSRGLETAIVDGFVAGRGRVFVNYNDCNGPQCLFELDARTMRQIGGPELYESDHESGPNVLTLDGDGVLWVATSGAPTRLLGLRVRDLD